MIKTPPIPIPLPLQTPPPPLPRAAVKTEDEGLMLFDYIFLQIGDQSEAQKLSASLLNRPMGLPGAELKGEELRMALYKEAHHALSAIPTVDMRRMQNPTLISTLDNPHSSDRRKKRARAYLRLSQAFLNCGANERAVIALYCRCRFNLTQVATILGLAQDQVVAIYGDAVAKMRTQIPSLPDDMRRNISQIPSYILDLGGGRNPKGTDILKLYTLMRAQRPFWTGFRLYSVGFFSVGLVLWLLWRFGLIR